ncbi:hypothetical protein [Piscibacillus halophilus]|uniref:hypothetical protein n=1 Tax=Piscibacillus halophilus TaxID=571933 RepID=UPI00158D9DEB|nr:hypothetical protein [Piscibacillus halophilus]
MKKKVIRVLVVAVVIALIVYIQMEKYKTVEDLLDEEIGDATVGQISLSKFDSTKERPYNTVARADIRDEATIERILDEFKSIDLKEVDEFYYDPNYRMQITYTREVKENYNRTKSLSLNVGKDYFQTDKPYDIRDDTDTDELIETLLEDEGVEWEDVE